MADYDEEDDNQPQPVMHPALAAINDALTDPVAQDVIGEATTRLNDYVQKRQIADNNEAAGQNFVDDLDTFKSGLVDFVKNDPHGVHAALDTVPPVIAGIVGSVPGHPEDQLDAHHAAITGHMQQEIATAAVTSAAERNAGFARDMLNHDRISGLIPDDHRDALNSYIDLQDDARSRDAAAQQQQAAEQSRLAADGKTFSYMSSLHDADTGDVAFPPGWNQALTADLSIPPANRRVMHDAFDRLQTNGDAATSDPWLVTSLVNSIAGGEKPGVADVFQHAGDGLRLSDALHIASLAGPRDIDGQDRVSGLANTLQAAREAIIGDGENGVAGARAYGKFVNWFLPQYRRSGPESINPNSDGFILSPRTMASFLPTGDDLNVVGPALEEAVRRYGGKGVFEGNEDALVPSDNRSQFYSKGFPDRMSLGDIFSGKRRAVTGDEVIHEPRMFRPTPQGIEPYKENAEHQGDANAIRNEPKDM